MQSAIDTLREQPVYRVSITWGHTDIDGQPVPPVYLDDALAYVKAELNRTCQGCRIQRDAGSYQHTNGATVDEDATPVSALGVGVDIPLQRFIRVARCVAHKLSQESVQLVVERLPGAVFFISGADA